VKVVPSAVFELTFICRLGSYERMPFWAGRWPYSLRISAAAESSERHDEMSNQYTSCRRQNYVCAAYVEAAVHINRVLGSDRAYWIMIREKVPAEVIKRILAGDERRIRRKDRRYATRREMISEPDLVSTDARKDTLTSQRGEVALVFQSMLDTNEAADYLRNAGVPIWVTARVLGSKKRRPSPALALEHAPDAEG
jgi:hypothetical protein